MEWSQNKKHCIVEISWACIKLDEQSIGKYGDKENIETNARNNIERYGATYTVYLICP